MRTITTCIAIFLVAAPLALPAIAAETPAEPPKSAIDQAVERDPRDPDAWIARGLKGIHSNHPELAIDDFNRALALDPKNASAYDGRGSAYTALQDPIKAHEDFDRAIDLDPKMAAAYRHRADNWISLAKTPLGKDILSGDSSKAPRAYAGRGFNSNNAPRQEPRTEHEPTVGPIGLANLDRAKADELDAQQYGAGAGGGGSGGGKGGGGAGSGKGAGGSGSGGKEDGDGAGGGKGGKGGGGGGKDGSGSGGAGKSGSGKGGSGKGGGGKSGSGGGSAGSGGKGANSHGHMAAGKGRKKPRRSLASYRRKPKVITTAPAETLPFIVYPQSVTRGTPQKLIADAAALAARMPAKNDAEGKGQQSPAREPLAAVDFYRDRNGNQKFDPDVDELLGADATGPAPSSQYYVETGTFSGAVDTSPLEPGDYYYFAVPKGAAGADGKPVAGEPLIAVGQVRAPSAPAIPPRAPTVVARDAIGGVGPPVGLGPSLGYSDDELASLEQAGGRDVAALRSWRDRDYPAAVAAYDRLLEAEPDNAVYLRGQGQALLADGRYDRAILDYDKLLSTGLADADLYYNRGCAELASGRLDRAIDDFSSSIKLNETGAMAYNNRGAALAKKGDFPGAIADFETALRLDPKDSLAEKNRALAQAKLSPRREAANTQLSAPGGPQTSRE